MESETVDKIKHLSNTEVIRRLLIKYMIDKGFDGPGSFDRQLNPLLLQDLVYVVPSLSSKIEIIPHAMSIDPTLGKASLGWNMFVIGSYRMFLGETFHNNLSELAREINSGLIKVPLMGGSASARRLSTPRRVISFILRILNEHDAGYVDLQPSQMPFRKPGEAYYARQTLSGMPQQFFSRSGAGY
jgi:hypothetical protein